LLSDKTYNCAVHAAAWITAWAMRATQHDASVCTPLVPPVLQRMACAVRL